MDSTRASAAPAGSGPNVTRALEEPSPSVTRLFMHRMTRGLKSASTSGRNLVDQSHLLFRAAHAYMSTIFRATPRRDVVDSSANTEPTAAGQPASVSVLADGLVLPSGQALDGSSRGFVTTPPMQAATPPVPTAVRTPRVPGAGVPDVSERSLALPVSADFSDLEGFTAAPLIPRRLMRTPATRISAYATHGGNVQRSLLGVSGDLNRDDVNHIGALNRDDVNHILNSPAFPDVQRNLFADRRDNDNLRPDDVTFVSNSPASPEALSGAQASRAKIDRSVSEAFGGSGVASRADASRPLDSSVVGTDAAPSSGYLDAMRAAGVMKAARGRDIRGDAPDGDIRGDATDAEAPPHPPAPNRTIDETPRSDPLQLHEYAVSGHSRGLAPSSGGPSQGIAPSRGRGRGGMNSLSPRTEGLNVRWTSGTAEGRGLVPTNLFGQDLGLRRG